ncbi:protein polybromo-1 [Hyalella azteca]|uniref:Protein polybromo-1 n=1 Tax=Hyalella azteca TaxID=294128 RepID=A0A8B7P4T2_HYAAZ|nr:protein polybromo-1 [Hyalella azteca]
MKRKRTEMSETSPSTDARPKRRRNDTTLLDTIQFIFDCLRNQRKQDEDVYLCEAFLRVPKKRSEPQYFEVVSKPIDMLKIQQKIKTDQYDELEEFCADIQLLVDNAKLYYAKSTEEFKDACDLWKLFEESRARAPDEVKEKQKQKQQQIDDDEKFPGKKKGSSSGRPSRGASAPLIRDDSGPAMDEASAIKELFGCIVTARDADDRLLSYVFRVLPSEERYPEYYTVIEKPIDLRTMAERLCQNKYATLDSIVHDFDLLFGNACTFNEPGSCIFRDACKLRKFVHSRKQDLIDCIASGKGRLRCRRPVGGKEWHELMQDMDESTVLPLAEEDLATGDELPTVGSGPPDDDDNDDDVDSENPLWQLFLLAKNLTVPSNPNYHLIEPFRRLPNRRWHADYYSEITHPISMSQIRNKIKKGEYSDILELQEDFNLMLNNAQQYNRPDSRIHRDAVTIQAAVHAAVSQILQSQGNDIPVIKSPSKNSSAAVQAQSSGGQSWADTDSEGEDPVSSAVGRRRPAASSGLLSFKRRAKLLFKTLMDYMTEDGRQPIVAFIEKPSRREYPDYYQVIEHPIDMETIEARIKSEYYGCEKELLADFRLMLNNCMTYNEEGSLIHSDALTLNKVLNDKVAELNQSSAVDGGAGVPQGQTHGTPSWPSMSTPSVAQSSKVLQLKKTKQQPPSGILRNIRSIYNAVVECRDADGRQISEVFMKLPSKILYPDYYELIKHPIDLERVLYKWKTGSYTSVDDCLADLTLLFNNACRYNEPESQIYRDALTLQQIALQKRLELVWQDVPRVKTLVQELLMSLFITVFNHEQDGRYTTESFADLPTQDPVAAKADLQHGSLTSKNRPLTFDILKRRLDKGLYSRLDHFQEDMFSIFTRARRLSSVNSRVFKDSVTLQNAYIIARDRLCGDGKILKSQALKFTKDDLDAEVAADAAIRTEEGEEQAAETAMDVDSKTSQETAPEASSTATDKAVYVAGEFVYAAPTEPSLGKRIVHIDRVFLNNSKSRAGNPVSMIQGYQYFRPEETFHPATRKFYAKEVFKTENKITIPVTDVVGRCLVLSVSDFQKMRATNIPEEDVYVCENRYLARHRFFKKIKMVPFAVPASVVLEERSAPLHLTKLDSIFKERIERHKEELAEVDEETRVNRTPLPNVARTSTTGTGELEFEQYNLGSGAVVKLGDFVYVKVPPIAVPGNSSSLATLKAIRHVTRIWLNPQGVCSFLGSVYSTAQELYMSGVQLDRTVAYKQEVYLTSVQDSLPLTDIIGRCSVLHVKEYAACRLTEVLEKDVYLCQNYFDETSRRISPLQSGIVKFQLSRQVLQDEVYYFSNAVNLQKAVLETVNLAQLPRRHATQQAQLGASGPVPLDEDLSNDLLVGEDSLDSSAAPSISSDSTPPSLAGHHSGAPASPAVHSGAITSKSAKKTPGRKQVSGYLLFSSEIRKSVTMRNPSANFGEISRLVGMEWKNLCEVERKAFEDRAHVVNQEAAEKALLGTPETPVSSVSAAHEMPLPTSPDIVFECMWGDCDVMFEDLADMYDHLLNEQTGHVCKVKTTFECQWRTCSRHKKNNLMPFPMLARLTRHTREVHLMKNTGRIIQPHDRSRNFVPSSRRSLVPAAAHIAPATPAATGVSTAANTMLPGFSLGKSGFQVSVLSNSGTSPAPTGLAGLLQNQRQPQILFAATPAKTQRLLHSEAYIKYIENLDKPYQGNWERQLHATSENTTINDAHRLPVTWLPAEYQTVAPPHVKLENGKDALSALWALRDIMVKDALCGRL